MRFSYFFPFLIFIFAQKTIASDLVTFELTYFNEQNECFDYGLVSATDEQAVFVDAYGYMFKVIDVIPKDGKNIDLYLELSSGVIQIITATIIHKVQQLTNGSM